MGRSNKNKPFDLEEGEKVNIQVKKNSGFVDVVAEGDITYKGVKSGKVEGYLATWDKDRGNDIFYPGAFLDSIADMAMRKRDLRLKDMHGRTIGVFDHTTLREDSKGLYGEGYINLEVQQGREAHSLIKQGAYDSFSVGFSVPAGGSKGEFPRGREIYKATLWETSVVDEPMNAEAVITSVKSVTSFQDLPLAEKSNTWDLSAAEKRVRAWAKAENGPNDSYKSAFLWSDIEKPDDFNSYKFLIADIVDEKLVAIPGAITAAAAAIKCNRGGVNILDEDKAKIRGHLDSYYSKLNKESPWGKKMLGEILGTEEEIKNMSVREIEKALSDAGCSKEQAKTLISNLKGVAEDDKEEKEMGDLLAELKTFSIDGAPTE